MLFANVDKQALDLDGLLLLGRVSNSHAHLLFTQVLRRVDACKLTKYEHLPIRLEYIV